MIRSALLSRICALSALFILAALVVYAAPTEADDEWSSWRGPWSNGVSPATGLISNWTVDGEHQLWRAPMVGRSTPAVFHGRVCANGRTEDPVMQATVGCWDAESGDLLWQHEFNIYNTTVPYTRVSWGSVAGDPETGALYYLAVDGRFMAFDPNGDTIWAHRLYEDYGFASGYGGRTTTPIVDEDRVLLGIIANSWAEYGPARHRYYAFDKRTGEVIWTSNPTTEDVKDRNTQSVPIVTEIDGRRMMIVGAADGWIYALDARTGQFIWRFQLSKRGINVSVVEANGVVFAAHSEENLDEGTLGRVVAIDGRGTGDVTRTHELWRANQVPVGFGSPLLHDEVLYVLDNSANLIAFEAGSGEELWEQNIGTVGKSSPVWADGKIYVTEVNGTFAIVQPGADGATVLDSDQIQVDDGRPAEIYGSPAIAYGRIYFTTEAGLFALGDGADAVVAAAPTAPARTMAPVDAEPAFLQVVPADVLINAGEPREFEARAYDAMGRLIGVVDAEWSTTNLVGEIGAGNTFTADPAAGSQGGHVIATLAGLEPAHARVRVEGPLPYLEDFTSGVRPRYWIGAGRFQTAERDGEPVLMKPPAPSGIHRHVAFTGRDSTTGVTVQIDVLGTQQGRRRPDVGLVNGGYTLDLQGNYQRIELRSWAAELRMMQRAPYEWESDTWYTLKLRLDQEADFTRVRAKVWPRDEPEPDEWNIETLDPQPIRHGAPGIYGYSPVDIYYDNYKVTVNE